MCISFLIRAALARGWGRAQLAAETFIARGRRSFLFVFPALIARFRVCCVASTSICGLDALKRKLAPALSKHGRRDAAPADLQSHSRGLARLPILNQPGHRVRSGKLTFADLLAPGFSARHAGRSSFADPSKASYSARSSAAFWLRKSAPSSKRRSPARTRSLTAGLSACSACSSSSH